ncbi:hypothetical protein QQS21_004997 [Conoideocrella luteorostrata]|uniref:ABC transmembrane type-1 domain-containing protein n=1 Tax=Conoideocrella luteorostrata TaxID=1105319 RepID=A0AAJ0CUI8_9HYPO|nr:hypothetical protein QQS21_004997 [Conoideocrella luteorostrata]
MNTATLTNRFSQDMELIEMNLPLVMINYISSERHKRPDRSVSSKSKPKLRLYTHFIEPVTGAATIRTLGWQPQYQKRNYEFIDQSQRPAYLQHCIQNWLGFVLGMLITVIAAVLVAVIVTRKEKFSAGNAGVSLVMIMIFNSILTKMIKTWTMMESSIGAVARVKSFGADTESEETGSSKAQVAQDWLTQGNVEFKDCSRCLISQREACD